ncbi:hypothetical protein LCGC14_2529800 [marine sediment metagenome]|uniref:Uncharacterized protein n=1 Tax=marine sediment metagenome TaxID=412755 RepID=A0A0F9D5G6_9ZZZZ
MKKLIVLIVLSLVFVSPIYGATPATSTTQTNTATSDGVGSSVNDNANSGVSLSNTVNENNIVPPATIPMVGTVSAQVTTPFGGVGFSKDAKYSKLITTIQFIAYMKANNFIDEKKAKDDALKVYHKLLKNVCGRSCVDKEESKGTNFSKDKKGE